MSKDLHNIDDIFNSVQQRLEEEPSMDVWDKINAGLDKKDAESYRKKFVGWKRVAIILLLVLSGFLLYESGIIKKGSGEKDNNAIIDQKPVPADRPAQNDNAVNIPKSESEKGINSSPKLPDDKAPNNGVNKFENPVTQQGIVSDKDNMKTKIISKGRNIGSNQIITISDASIKNKATTNNKLPISNKQNKPDKGPVEDLLLTDKNSKLKLPAPDINNSLVGKNPAIETSAIGQTRISRVEKIPVTENLTQRILSGKSLFLLIPDSVLSNSIAKPTPKKGKEKFKPYWMVTGYASNDWAQYKLDNDIDDNTGPNHNEKEVISKREKHESSFSAGIIATWQFKKHSGIKTGLIYSNTAIVIDPQKIYAAQAPNGNISYKYITSSGYAYVKPGFGLPPAIGDSLNATSAQHKLQSLSIPVLLTYKVVNKKLSIAPSAGITANFITSAKIETEVEDALNRETVTINGLNGTKHFYIGLMADVNLQYNLNKKWSFNILPTFNYAISPITKSNVVKTYPYSVGVGAGVSYKF